ncbi:MAG: hypothetical protein C4589_05900 [Peptococcaceae bacterium]|jgi:uncharacterized protein (TIGR02186 family)|nr:MAG: hypothetical protein C4589_05900 [Peptococcaceae bacterium]
MKKPASILTLITALVVFTVLAAAAVTPVSSAPDNGNQAAVAGPLALATEIDNIDVGMNFNGSQIKFSGQAPEGSAIFLKVLSPDKKVGLSKQGRKGPVWLTVETVQVSRMPGMFQVMSSGKIEDLPPALQQEMGIEPGYPALKKTAEVTSKHDEKTVVLPPEEANEFIEGLVRINEKKGLYRYENNAVEVSGSSFKGTINIPPDVPRGESKIYAYAVKDGKIAGTAVKDFKVTSVGLVQSLNIMAQQNAVAYGIMAVVVALGAGLLVSAAFKEINRIIFKDDSSVGTHH